MLAGRDIFKRTHFDKNVKISIRISLKCVPNGLIDIKSTLVQVRTWRRTGDKPLFEPMPTQFTDACKWH